MDNDRKLIVVDENGKEVEMEILFTFDADENDPKFRGNKYVLFFDPKAEEQIVHVSRYIENGNGRGRLEGVPADATDEWEMIEEVYNTFVDDEDEDEDE